MLILGLTGSIGMGKSATADIFRRAGVKVHDSDRAVHDLYAGDARHAIGAEFPEALTPTGIDRQILGRIVLQDAEALRRLEAIVHPSVTAARMSFLRERRGSGDRIVVCDIPLLFEIKAEHAVDVILVVSAPADVQKARVLARPGMTQARFDAIVAKQMSDGEKRRRAHAVIDTGRGHDAAERQVDTLLKALAALSGSKVRDQV